MNRSKGHPRRRDGAQVLPNPATAGIITLTRPFNVWLSAQALAWASSGIKGNMMAAVDSDVRSARSQGPEKIKVFISYSRADIDFVDRLQQALVARSVRAYVDREDIAKGEAWWTRIQQLIAEADTIIFVLSQASVGSPICQQEIDFAASLNKRFIPVVAADLGDTPVPDALARLNYIFFFAKAEVRSGGDFDEAVDQLAHALDTDLDWIRRHTRYGERAAEWQRAERSANRLMRSANIDEAEAWRDRRPDRAPEITELQLAYIAESRRAATRRQRWWIGGSVAIAIITSVLAVYAVFQQRAAVANQARSVRVLASSDFQQGTQEIESPETTPQGLAFLARSVRGGQDERALTRLWTVLQQRSFWLPQGSEAIAPAPPRPEGREGMAAISVHGASPQVPIDVAQRFARHTVDGVEQDTKFITVSGDGSRVLTVVGDVALEGTEVKARVWHADGRPISEWFEPDYRGGTYIFSLTGVFSHDGRFLALEVIGNREPAFLEIWDLDNGTRFDERIELSGLRPQFQNSWFNYIAFLDQPGADRNALATLVTTSVNGDARVHFVHDGYISRGGRTQHREFITYVALDDRGEWLMSGGEDGTVHIASSLDMDRAVGSPINLPTRITRIVRDSEDGLVVDTAGGSRTRYHLLKPMQVRLPDALELAAAGPDCIEWPDVADPQAEEKVTEFVPQSQVGLSYLGPRSFRVLADGETHESPLFDVNIALVCLDGQGDRISVTTRDFVTQIWDIGFAARLGPPLDEKRYFGPGRSPEETRSVVLSADGSRVLVRSFFWNPPNVAYWWFNFWDVGTALPLIDRKNTIDWGETPVADDAVLDTSDAFLAFVQGTERKHETMIDVIQIKPPPGVASWLPDFAEAVGGMTFDEAGLPVYLSDAERVERLNSSLEQIRRYADNSGR